MEVAVDDLTTARRSVRRKRFSLGVDRTPSKAVPASTTKLLLRSRSSAHGISRGRNSSSVRVSSLHRRTLRDGGGVVSMLQSVGGEEDLKRSSVPFVISWSHDHPNCADNAHSVQNLRLGHKGSVNGDNSRSNWLMPDATTGDALVLELSRTIRVERVLLQNTGNNDSTTPRGTKELVIHTKSDTQDTWVEAARLTLPDARGDTVAERHALSKGESDVTVISVVIGRAGAGEAVRWIKFEVLSHYGKGAGLQSITLLPPSHKTSKHDLQKGQTLTQLSLPDLADVRALDGYLQAHLVVLRQATRVAYGNAFFAALQAVQGVVVQALHITTTQSGPFDSAPDGRTFQALFQKHFVSALRHLKLLESKSASQVKEAGPATPSSADFAVSVAAHTSPSEKGAGRDIAYQLTGLFRTLLLDFMTVQRKLAQEREDRAAARADMGLDVSRDSGWAGQAGDAPVDSVIAVWEGLLEASLEGLHLDDDIPATPTTPGTPATPGTPVVPTGEPSAAAVEGALPSPAELDDIEAEAAETAEMSLALAAGELNRGIIGTSLTLLAKHSRLEVPKFIQAILEQLLTCATIPTSVMQNPSLDDLRDTPPIAVPPLVASRRLLRDMLFAPIDEQRTQKLLDRCELGGTEAIEGEGPSSLTHLLHAFLSSIPGGVLPGQLCVQLGDPLKRASQGDVIDVIMRAVRAMSAPKLSTLTSLVVTCALIVLNASPERDESPLDRASAATLLRDAGVIPEEAEADTATPPDIPPQSQIIRHLALMLGPALVKIDESSAACKRLGGVAVLSWVGSTAAWVFEVLLRISIDRIEQVWVEVQALRRAVSILRSESARFSLLESETKGYAPQQLPLIDRLHADVLCCLLADGSSESSASDALIDMESESASRHRQRLKKVIFGTIVSRKATFSAIESRLITLVRQLSTKRVWSLQLHRPSVLASSLKELMDSRPDGMSAIRFSLYDLASTDQIQADPIRVFDHPKAKKGRGMSRRSSAEKLRRKSSGGCAPKLGAELMPLTRMQAIQRLLLGAGHLFSTCAAQQSLSNMLATTHWYATMHAFLKTLSGPNDHYCREDTRIALSLNKSMSHLKAPKTSASSPQVLIAASLRAAPPELVSGHLRRCPLKHYLKLAKESSVMEVLQKDATPSPASSSSDLQADEGAVPRPISVRKQALTSQHGRQHPQQQGGPGSGTKSSSVWGFDLTATHTPKPRAGGGPAARRRRSYRTALEESHNDVEGGRTLQERAQDAKRQARKSQRISKHLSWVLDPNTAPPSLQDLGQAGPHAGSRAQEESSASATRVDSRTASALDSAWDSSDLLSWDQLDNVFGGTAPLRRVEVDTDSYSEPHCYSHSQEGYDHGRRGRLHSAATPTASEFSQDSGILPSEIDFLGGGLSVDELIEGPPQHGKGAGHDSRGSQRHVHDLERDAGEARWRKDLTTIVPDSEAFI